MKESTRYKGIILAGGSGTRLYPVTQAMGKSLLPVYNKPMIYYPLCTLMLAGIRDILVISTPEDVPKFQALLQDGSQFGIRLQYQDAAQAGRNRAGIPAGAGVSGRQSLRSGAGRQHFLRTRSGERSARGSEKVHGARVFAYPVHDPERYGVVEFDAERTRAEHRGETEAAEIAIRRDRTLFLRQPGGRDREVAEAERARRTRNHRRQPDVLEERTTRSCRHGTRHGVARHGHARIADGCRALHSGDRKAAGVDGGVSRGDRVPVRLHHGGPGGKDCELR